MFLCFLCIYLFFFPFILFIYPHAIRHHDIHSPKQTTLISGRASIYIFLIPYLNIYISSITLQSLSYSRNFICTGYTSLSLSQPIPQTPRWDRNVQLFQKLLHIFHLLQSRRPFPPHRDGRNKRQ